MTKLIGNMRDCFQNVQLARAIFAFCAVVVAGGALGAWQLPFDQITFGNRDGGGHHQAVTLSTLSVGDVVHVLSTVENRVAVRGFDGAGKLKYTLDLAPFNVLVGRLSRIKGSSSVLLAAGGVAVKISEQGGVAWRVPLTSGIDEFTDAYEYADGTVLLAFKGVYSVNNGTRLYRVTPTGVIDDARLLIYSSKAELASFDAVGNFVFLGADNVLSRIDGRTMEATPAWTRLNETIFALASARDGGIVVRTLSAIKKLSFSGVQEWSVPSAISPNASHRLVETVGGDWLAYDFMSPTARSLSVNASGVVNFARIASAAEFERLSDDGSSFLDVLQPNAFNPFALFEINSASGALRAVSGAIFPYVRRPTRLNSNWVVVAAGTSAQKIQALNPAGQIL